MAQSGTVQRLTDLNQRHVPEDERELRVHLAAAYRMVDFFGWSSLIYGHLTARVPGPERHFLINPFGLMYDEVTASNLVKIDIDGNIVETSGHPVNQAGFVIHSAVHMAREDARCVMHTHTRAGMAVAAMAGGLRRYDFAGISLHDRVAYHDFEGVTVRNDERERLIESLGNKNFMILRNHGLLVCGGTVAHAIANLYCLEMACQVQTTAMAANTDLIEPSPALSESHARALEEGDTGELAFQALMRLMDRRDPSYRD